MVRAIGLLSGGLDSTLACRLMLDQGIDVVAINFSTGFCLTDARRAIRRKKDAAKDLRHDALKAAAGLEIPIHVIDISREYFREVLLQPKYGFGANLNPCVDCRIYMFRKARELMKEFDAQFVFTGEVLDQRPMSQHRPALRTIEREAGLEGLILRPLSARLLPPTIPEQKGWVDREKLLAIQGRSRKVQMELARKYGIEDYPTPAGGCCTLVDPAFARRLQDYLLHHPTDYMDPKDVLLLKVGRHFRIDRTTKVIVGREEAENNFLQLRFRDRPRLTAADVPGATAVIEGNGLTESTIRIAARLAARYSKAKDRSRVPVRVMLPEKGEQLLTVPPADENLIRSLLIE